MSGQKDVRIQRVDPALIEAQRRRQAELVEEERRREAAVQESQRRVGEVSRQIEASSSRLRELEQKHQKINQDIDQVIAARRRLQKQLKEMSAEARQAQSEVKVLVGDIEADHREIERQLGELAALERSLQASLTQAEAAMAQHDGREAAALRATFEKLDREHGQLVAEHAGLQAELAAFSSDPLIGTVLHEMLDVSRELGFSISKVFASEQEVEIFITNAQDEIIRLATRLKKEQLEEWTRDGDLRQILMEGEGQPTTEHCLADTIQLLERLRERGIMLELRLGQGISGTSPERSRIGERGSLRERNS